MTEDATAGTQPAIERWLRTTSDDRAPIIEALCVLVEEADDRVVGEIKWNAPSYRITEHFATTGLERKGGVRLVLHTGAVKRAAPLPIREHVDDPTGLLTWKGSDRAVAQFGSVDEVRDAREALSTIVQQWISAMDAGNPASAGGV